MNNLREKRFLNDAFSFGPYIINCFEGLTRRLLKKDVIIVVLFLIFILWVRFMMSKNFKIIEVGLDAVFVTYNGIADLLNIILKIFKFIFHVIEKIEKFFHLDTGLIKSFNSVINDVVSVNLYIFKISQVNQVLNGLGNSRAFVTASELKNIFAELAGNEMCFFARAIEPTILSPLGYVLSFGFHGGYKPEPSNIYENCMVQMTTPGLLTNWLNLVLFFLQVITTLLVLYLIIIVLYVFRNPKKYKA